MYAPLQTHASHVSVHVHVCVSVRHAATRPLQTNMVTHHTTYDTCGSRIRVKTQSSSQCVCADVHVILRHDSDNMMPHVDCHYTTRSRATNTRTYYNIHDLVLLLTDGLASCCCDGDVAAAVPISDRRFVGVTLTAAAAAIELPPLVLFMAVWASCSERIKRSIGQCMCVCV